GGITDVALDEPEPRTVRDGVAIAAVARVGQLVAHADLGISQRVVRAGQRLPHVVRADETRAARDQNPHRVLPQPRLARAVCHARTSGAPGNRPESNGMKSNVWN